MSSLKDNAVEALTGAFFAVLAGFCLVSGSIQAYAARSLSIDVTGRLHLQVGAILGDDGVVRIEGLPVPGLATLTFVTVLAVVLIAWALYNRRAGWGTVACGLGFTGALALWFNTHAIAGIYGIANCVGCSHGDGGWGEAQWDINTAGALYAFAILLISSALVWFQRLDQRDLPSLQVGPWLER